MGISKQEEQEVERLYQYFIEKRRLALANVQNFARRDSAQEPPAFIQGPNTTSTILNPEVSSTATPALTNATTSASSSTSPPAPSNLMAHELPSPTAVTPPNPETYNEQILHLTKQVAHECQLRAWHARLGYPAAPNYTFYSSKTTTLACLKLRDLLQDGDTETGLKGSDIPNKQAWEERLSQTNFSFRSICTAIDFLSYLGLGANKFGSGRVQIEVTRLVRRRDGTCMEAQHKSSGGGYGAICNFEELAEPCGCMQELLMWQKFLNETDEMAMVSMGAEVPKHAETVRALQLGMRVKRAWEKKNWPEADTGISETTEWPESGEIKVIEQEFGGKTFEFEWWKEDSPVTEKRSITMRVTGPFAELI